VRKKLRSREPRKDAPKKRYYPFRRVDRRGAARLGKASKKVRKNLASTKDGTPSQSEQASVWNYRKVRPRKKKFQSGRGEPQGHTKRAETQCTRIASKGLGQETPINVSTQKQKATHPGKNASGRASSREFRDPVEKNVHTLGIEGGKAERKILTGESTDRKTHHGGRKSAAGWPVDSVVKQIPEPSRRKPQKKTPCQTNALKKNHVKKNIRKSGTTGARGEKRRTPAGSLKA